MTIIRQEALLPRLLFVVPFAFATEKCNREFVVDDSYKTNNPGPQNPIVNRSKPRARKRKPLPVESVFFSKLTASRA